MTAQTFQISQISQGLATGFGNAQPGSSYGSPGSPYGSPGSPYGSYVYSYPHKTSYRPFTPVLPLEEVWAAEPKDHLFLYTHIPFCEMRCGYCNLFSQSRPDPSLVTGYLETLYRQAAAIGACLGPITVAEMAIGGGTPTFLSLPDLEKLFRVYRDIFQIKKSPLSIEASPGTVTAEKLAFLAEQGVTRLSLGVESFDSKSCKAIGRPQKASHVAAALQAIRDSGIPSLNIDLIYGSQSLERWSEDLSQALAWEPEDLYLYPLYVRPLTGLGRQNTSWDDHRLALYHLGRETVQKAGYEQLSMRHFKKRGQGDLQTPYRCDRDGMIGLGCGARSYTRQIHYASPYAVRQDHIAALLQKFKESSESDFQHVSHGYRLSHDDQQRRVVLLSLLQASGLDRNGFHRRFGVDVLMAFPLLQDFAQRSWLCVTDDHLVLTEEGMAFSDWIGPQLFSGSVTRLMEDYVWQ